MHRSRPARADSRQSDRAVVAKVRMAELGCVGGGWGAARTTDMMPPYPEYAAAARWRAHTRDVGPAQSTAPSPRWAAAPGGPGRMMLRRLAARYATRCFFSSQACWRLAGWHSNCGPADTCAHFASLAQAAARLSRCASLPEGPFHSEVQTAGICDFEPLFRRSSARWKAPETPRMLD